MTDPPARARPSAPADRASAGGRHLRLLHASDCHLGLGRLMSNEAAFSALVDLAIAEEVDAIVIAGDLFDSPRVGAPTLEWTVGELRRAGRPIVIVPGNHDMSGGRSAFATVDFERECAGVHVLDAPGGELVALPELDLACYGRAVHDHDPGFRPLADLPPRPDTRWCVVVGHGLVLDRDGPTDRGSPIYPRDLDSVDWDYVALGHWPVFLEVRCAPVPVVYAGNTARSRDGRPGVVLVDMVPDGGVTPTWTPLAV